MAIRGRFLGEKRAQGGHADCPATYVTNAGNVVGAGAMIVGFSDASLKVCLALERMRCAAA